MYQFIKYKKYSKLVIVALAVIICGAIYLVQMIPQKSAGESILLQNDSTVALVIPEGGSGTKEATSTSDLQTSRSDDTKQLIYIYVCGYVNAPGVLSCPEGSRVYQLIEQAGGFSDLADETSLNLVDTVKDGQKIYVPSKEERVALSGSTTSEQKPTLVNINKATKEQLMTLPGIGESKANDIISYRSSNGAFKSTGDIMNISGIKEAAYNKIKDYICVN